MAGERSALQKKPLPRREASREGKFGMMIAP